VNQRWAEGRTSFRPAEPISPRAYDVAALDSDNEARAFVLLHHYSGSYPAARFRFGLWKGGRLAGVAVFSHPCNDKVLTGVFPFPVANCVELGRFVLLEEVPGNGESWFLARCFDQLRARGIKGVVSFSDPVPRQTAAGASVFPGHYGCIYQASNAAYLGRGTARTLRLLPDGRVLSPRTLQKIRAGEAGWRGGVELLTAFGAQEPGEDRRSWLAEWLPRLTRTLRHPGCYKYAWALGRRAKSQVVRSARPWERLDYPKPEVAQWN
jgi:hypothetical protein